MLTPVSAVKTSGNRLEWKLRKLSASVSHSLLYPTQPNVLSNSRPASAAARRPPARRCILPELLQPAGEWARQLREMRGITVKCSGERRRVSTGTEMTDKTKCGDKGRTEYQKLDLHAILRGYDGLLNLMNSYFCTFYCRMKAHLQTLETHISCVTRTVM